MFASDCVSEGSGNGSLAYPFQDFLKLPGVWEPRPLDPLSVLQHAARSDCVHEGLERGSAGIGGVP